jgi:alkane 1-monooxygenase
MIKDFKYLLGYIIPLLTFAAIIKPEYFAFATVAYAFGLIPLAELFLKPDASSIAPKGNSRRFTLYDFILYLSLPFLWGVLALFVWQIKQEQFTSLQLIGMMLSVGVVCGAIGINIAHELGHRSGKVEQWVAKLLLISTQYSHFIVEHNHGHHRYVATPLDPATARKGESVYRFWVRSIVGSYSSAWNIQMELLRKGNASFFSLHNEMLWMGLAQITLIVTIGLLFGFYAMILYLMASLTGILLLETINYVEHYGLMRRVNDSGTYERVQHIHSWNADYPLGRLILFELPRHSDHHYKASKKYQFLESPNEAPQLPAGYPAMILLSLAPPLWFALMNKRITEQGGGLSKRQAQYIA